MYEMNDGWMDECRGVDRGAKGAAAPPLLQKKREEGEEERKEEKAKRGFKKGKKLNQSFQEHVFMGL